MTLKSFENELAESLQWLSCDAPRGPRASSIIDALHRRGIRRRRQVRCVTASLVLLVAGLVWFTGDRFPGESTVPLKLATVVMPVVDQRPSVVVPDRLAMNSHDGDHAAILRYLKSIPIEALVTIRMPAIAATSPVVLEETWNPTFRLDEADYASLASHHGCLFCLSVPKVSTDRPF